jgi:hypothetical protein
VGGGGGVAGQRLGVADVHQAHHQLQRVDEARAAAWPPLMPNDRIEAGLPPV